MLYPTFERTYPATLQYLVSRVTNSEKGGYESAEITVTGGPDELADIQDLVYLIDSRVKLYDEFNDYKWDGYVEEVQITRGGSSWGVSLDGMSNSISVVYSDDTGERGTTAWASDAESVTLYGIKETRHSVTSMDAASAVLKRDAALKELSRPQAVASFDRNGDDRETIRATISCAGLWLRTEWRYYETSDGVIESANAEGSGAQNFGEGSGIKAANQTFPLIGTRTFTHVEIPCQKMGDPGIGYPIDSINVSIHDGAITGTVLSLASVLAVDIPIDGIRYVRAALSPPLAALGGDPVTLQVQRSSGVNDPTKYFRIQIDETKSFNATSMQVYVDPTGWRVGGIPNDGNLCFRLLAPELVTTQIKTAVLRYCPYIVATDIIRASDVTTIPFSDGDKLLIDELEKLMSIATVNGLPLQAIITNDRRLEIRERSFRKIYIASDGTMYDDEGRQVRPTDCPVGVEYRPLDIFPTLETSYHYGKAAGAIATRTEYTATYDDVGNLTREVCRIVPRGAVDPFADEMEQG